ncbi:hypothetical protein NC796_24090 [Aliifodinibius sp. S!AR15-10]|uniref:hypothetical protein n=1 Tax=Aliifodinibius sp. S!AR15-10 TaxID=2950437 RepID=UPI00285FF63E|nr:hypothetical protein [Aliifodinibius sp. S!AR15-10]MDR8394251.1 hypothetical protein [Aliifodinibius sp. S!AR15-10]
MIKKMMTAVADNKDVIASRQNKSGDGKGSTTKGLFRSLLSSMKGKLENEVEQGDATKQNAKNVTAKPGERKANEKSDSLMQRLNNTTEQGKTSSTASSNSENESGKKSADQKADLSDEKDNTGEANPDNKAKMKAGQLNGENPVPQNKKGESETKESGTAKSEKKKINKGEVDSAPVASTTKTGEADKNSNNTNAENVSKDKGETQAVSPPKTNIVKEQADIPAKQKDKDQDDAGQASKTKSANATAGSGSVEQNISKQAQSGKVINKAGVRNRSTQPLSEHSISKGSGSQKQSVMTTASNGDQPFEKIKSRIQESPKVEGNNSSQKQEENRSIFTRIERNGEGNEKQNSAKRLRGPMRDQRVSKISERRALAFKKVTDGGSNSYSITRGESDKKLSVKQEKLFNSLATKGSTGNSFEKGIAIQAVQADQAQKEENKKRFPSFTAREQRTEGNRVNRDRDRRFLNQFGKLSAPSTNAGISNVAGDFSTGSEIQFDEEKIVWKEHASESVESKGVKGTEQRSSAHVKLGQVPVSNISLRRKLVPGLTKAVRTAAGESKKTPETWQKHNFTLDDGKKIHLSARQVKGVLQLKLGSLHGDLNRLLQQHQQQIREHLEQECGTEIDLQLENSGEQQMSEFFGGSNSSPAQRGEKGGNVLGAAKTTSDKTDRELTESVRNFGYNKMEWTA